MFGKTYELSLNRNYVSHWGLAEAVRELIQNALDSESPFQYEFQRDGDTIALSLRSEFTTLSPRTLLLGSTSKAGSTDSIGSFGEGYKIALLVLTRLGHRVLIANGDKLWVPRFKFNSRFDEELLVVEESNLNYRHSGLTFQVQGLTDSDVEAITESCLQMQEHVGETKTTSYGEILLEKPGKLYVGGLYICDTELKYGYNIKPEHIKLERDRQTVSSWDLKFITKQMWFDTEEWESIAQMVEEGVEDVIYVEYGSPQMVKEACYQLFKRQHPGAVAAASQRELRELVSRGMERVVVVGGAYYSQITRSSSYASEIKPSTETVQERMKRWLSKHRGHMRTEAIVAFKELIEESKDWKRK